MTRKSGCRASLQFDLVRYWEATQFSYEFSQPIEQLFIRLCFAPLIYPKPSLFKGSPHRAQSHCLKITSLVSAVLITAALP